MVETVPVRIIVRTTGFAEIILRSVSKKQLRGISRLCASRGLPTLRTYFHVDDLDSVIADNESIAAGLETDYSAIADVIRQINGQTRDIVRRAQREED